MTKNLFIANIGNEKKIEPNGVNIKNKHIKKYLERKNQNKLTTIDTNNWKDKKLNLITKIVLKSLTHDKIVLSINSISAYKTIKILTKLNLGIEKKIIYIVVGGSFARKLVNKELDIKKFENLKQIFVQTKQMKYDLEALGLTNISFLPNSKYFEKPMLKTKKEEKVLKCVYLGRIHPDKGIDFIFKNLKKLNKAEMKYSIDFFGPIDKGYESIFKDHVNSNTFAKYNGILDFNNHSIEAYQNLMGYELFLFPTFWEGEGFPGVIIDSFISGVPVLASDWNHNSEVIDNNLNGLIFKTNDNLDFSEKLKKLYNERKTLDRLRLNAYKSADSYHSSEVLKKIDLFL